VTDRRALLAALFELDASLERHGVPPLSAKWRAELTRWAERGSRRLVIRAGRRSGKSLTLCKLAIAMALFGGVSVPTGDTAWAVFVSTTVAEALARLTTIRTFLDLLGVVYEPSGNQVRLAGAPLGFVVVACSFRSAVGMTAFMVAGDEMSRWEVDSVNPADEVWTSLAPMTATIEQAVEVASSSPLGTLDLHAEFCEDGDTDAQTFVEGPTWLFNPTVSEERCRQLARTPREFEREYRAVPQGNITACFEQDDALRAFGAMPDGYQVAGWVCLVDPSGGGDDPWAFGFASWLVGPRVPEFLTERRYIGGGVEYEDYVRGDDGKPIPNPLYEQARKPPILRVARYGQIADARAEGLTLEVIVRGLVRAHCRPNGVRLMVGDQYEAFAMASEVPKHGVAYRSFAWTQPTKLDAVARVASWMRDGVLSIETGNPHEGEFKKQLLSFDERISKSGAIKYSGRGSVHDDLVSVLLLAARADAEGLLPMSPYFGQPRVSRADVLRQLNQRFGDRSLGPGPNGARGRWMIDASGNDRGVTFSR